MKSGLLDDSVLFVEVISEMRKCHQKNKDKITTDHNSSGNQLYSPESGKIPQNSFSNNISQNISEKENEQNLNSNSKYNYRTNHNIHNNQIKNMKTSDFNHLYSKSINSYQFDQTNSIQEIDQPEEDEMSLCSTDGIRRNSMRSSIVEDSDSFSYLERRRSLFSAESYCETENSSHLIGHKNRFQPFELSYESTYSHFDKKNEQTGFSFESMRNYIAPNDLFLRRPTNVIRNGNISQNNTVTDNAYPTNDLCHTYNSSYTQQLSDHNEDMKKYFYKITSLRKKIFACEYCTCKFVYKKCLDNHLEKNH